MATAVLILMNSNLVQQNTEEKAVRQAVKWLRSLAKTQKSLWGWAVSVIAVLLHGLNSDGAVLIGSTPNLRRCPWTHQYTIAYIQLEACRKAVHSDTFLSITVKKKKQAEDGVSLISVHWVTSCPPMLSHPARYPRQTVQASKLTRI